MSSEQIAKSKSRWEQYRWTNALLATTDEANVAEGSLGGLTFTIKDTFATAGIASTGGSLVLKDHIPKSDAVVVDRLKSEGASLFGKGNCAEFGNGIHSETRIGGRVLHPFDPTVSPGGSSGGDAVAVAAGIVDFAIGGDYGGSVRWPAQCVGVYGLRTSSGLVPRTGRIPSAGAIRSAPVVGPPAPLGLLASAEAVGVLAPSIAMIVRVLRVIAGPDGEDWWGLSTAPPPHQRLRRVAMTTGRECGPIGDESLEGLARARDAAVRAGYEIVDAEGILCDAVEIYNTLRADLDVFDDLREVVGPDIDLLCAGTRKVLDGPPGRGWASAAVRRTWAQSRVAIARIGSIFSTVDALLVPVAAVSAVAHDSGIEVDGRFIEGPDLMAQCRAISLTGFPSLSVPIADVNGQRTVSIQIVGPPGGDLRCCEVAADLKGESAL